jgi:putative holliday junction resolvase
MRVMAVDFGERRVGIAVSDSTGMIAQPWTILRRGPEVSNDVLAERVAALAVELGVELVLLGLPLSSAEASDGEGFQARRVRRFGDALSRRLSMAMEYWDESLTSADAEDALRSAGRRRKYIDDVAAAVLLQSYLDRQ